MTTPYVTGGVGTYHPTLTIAGVAVDMRVDSLRITETANGRNRLDVVVVSPAGSYRPDLGAEILLLEDDGPPATRLFGGIVDGVTERGLSGIGMAPLELHITAADFNSYADRRLIKAFDLYGTLQAALQRLVIELESYGVTLAGDQAIGPTLPLMHWDYRRCSEVLSELSTLSISGAPGTQYLWDIDYNKVLSMRAIGSVSAPFNVAVNDGNVIGDVQVEPTFEHYANRVIVRFPRAATQAEAYTMPTAINHAETVTIDTRVYTFDIVLNDTADHIAIGATVTDTLTNLALALEAAPGTGQGTLFGSPTTPHESVYGYVPRPGLLTIKAREAGADGNDIALAETLASGVWQSAARVLPFVEHLYGGLDEALIHYVEANDLAEQTARGLWEMVIAAPEIYDFTQAQGVADGALLTAVASATGHRVTYLTGQPHVHPGQTQSITLPTRNLSGSFLVTDVEIFMNGPYLWRRVTAVGGSRLPQRWQDDARSALSQGGASSTIAALVVVGGGGTGTPAVPAHYWADLGGSDRFDVLHTTWVPVPNYRVWVAPASATYTVRTEVWVVNASDVIQPRLYDVTAGVSVGAGASTSATTRTERNFTVNAIAGHKYRLEVAIYSTATDPDEDWMTASGDEDWMTASGDEDWLPLAAAQVGGYGVGAVDR